MCDGCRRGRNKFAVVCKTITCVSAFTEIAILLIFFLEMTVEASRAELRLSVCDGCRRGRNEFAGHVQNHDVRFSFHRNSHIINILS